jgi:CoA:oxalate CoA-transferase
MSQKKGNALAGVRVLDFTQFLSGPFGTQILGDLGADVVKIEGPQGDLARHIPPYFVGDDSVYYLSVNRNKRSLMIDMKTAEGIGIVRRLVARCDVVVENFRPGVLARLGLSSDALREEVPSLIWCAISGFGQTGPYRDKPAYDMVVQAISGGMSLTGEPEGPSVRAGIPIADLAAGMYAAIGILAALRRRDINGQGETIDVSMLDCQAAMLSYQGAYHLHSGIVPGRQGRAHDSFPTYRSFCARDGVDVVVTANTENMWRGLCAALDRAALVDDPRFRTNRDRHANQAALLAILKPAFLERDAAEWVLLLEQQHVPVGIVNSLDRVVQDPQIADRGMVLQLTGSQEREVRVMGNPLLSAGPDQSHLYPPALGAQSHEILSDLLGLSTEDIAGLCDRNIISVNPV